jgi:acyl carrier protein
VETVINDYISRELVSDAALLPLANETSLLESDILDSLNLLRLVVFLEERFGITMGDADLLPENFDSVNTVCAYLRARDPGTLEAAHG